MKAKQEERKDLKEGNKGKRKEEMKEREKKGLKEGNKRK